VTGLDQIPEGAVWAIMLLPLASFALISLAAFLGLTNDRRPDGPGPVLSPRLSGYLTIVAIGISFLLSLWALDGVLDSDGARIGFDAHEWVVIGTLNVEIGITLDGLTGIMLVVVTSVALLVQIYSQEYMRGDPGYNRYFAYMSLFTASMLGLVLASSILQIFVFWELVGLCSYLLIGFWFYKDSARRAATKAFVVTRIGDVGFMLAILLIWSETDTLSVPDIQDLAATGAISSTVITWFSLGIFAGAMGKSAQFPLHVWLPDAMEGPTPVSALIHAATMVAAGVYLVARFFPVVVESDDALATIAIIGSITAIGAAFLGIVATDIKRVMAYSTISQLGYMMMALGVGGIAAAIFHLFTHAFFKSQLFLSSGSVNHATGTFDMRKMGGLRRHMPVTFVTMTIASLALVGVFPLAGFWSKDEILSDAYVDKEWVFAVALVGVFMTAIYVGRMLFMTFGGEYKGGEPIEHAGVQGDSEEEHAPTAHHSPSTPHESPALMLIPLVILAIMSVIAGLFNLNDDITHLVTGWLPHETEELITEGEFELWIAVVSGVFGIAGLVVAWAIYGAELVSSERIRRLLGPLPKLFENKYYLDYLYEEILVKEVLLGSVAFVTDLFDRYVVDGVVNGVARLARWSSQELRLAQVGQAQLYGAVLVVGALAAVAAMLVVNPP
jgi:NADH-quinone oxidoreductase subunit L